MGNLSSSVNILSHKANKSYKKKRPANEAGFFN